MMQNVDGVPIGYMALWVLGNSLDKKEWCKGGATEPPGGNNPQSLLFFSSIFSNSERSGQFLKQNILLIQFFVKNEKNFRLLKILEKFCKK